MTQNLKAYTLNKLLSVTAIFILILGSFWFFGYTETQWQFILIALITMGYGHFIIGFIYQWRLFFRKEKPWQHIVTFGVLSLFSITLAVLLFEVVGHAYALLIGFIYFLLHGLFNEQTLIKREAGIDVPLNYIFALAIFIMALLTYTIPDPTFLFNRALEFLTVNDFLFVQLFKAAGMDLAVFPYIFWLGVVSSFLVLGWSWWKTKFHTLTLLLAGIFGAVTIATILFGALPYVYMYMIVVGYHFMTWFLFFLRSFAQNKPKELPIYMWLHVIVLLPFVIGGWEFFQAETPDWVYLLFDYHLFVVVTYIHISVSFMNDQWFQKLQEKTFRLFE